MSKIIVSLADSPSQYVDDLWFRTHLLDDQTKFEITPVIIKGMNIRWYIREPEGKLFFEEILNLHDLSLFKIVTIQILVEYFYLKYKAFLFTNDLPLFLGKLILFAIQMFSNESLTFEERNANKTYLTIQVLTLTFQLFL